MASGLIKEVKGYEYDVELSKKMLAEAGWAPGSDGILTKDGEDFLLPSLTALDD